METTHAHPDINGGQPLVQEEFWQGSRRIYIIFAGLMGHIGMPPEVLFRSGGIIDQSRIILRDPYQNWYQRGVPTVGRDVFEVAEFLERRIAASGASEVRFFGNCKGGFAALLFCSLLGRGHAVATVPQTYLSPERQRLSGDPRGQALTAEMYQHRAERHIYDLKPWMAQHSPNISADIYVANNPYDLAHARELEGFQNIRVHYLKEGGHRVAMKLEREGRLERMLAI